jgi:hypothetical protein
MDQTGGEFHHGDMPVGEQTHTYLMFNRLTKWAALHIAVLIVIFALWFCVGAGFFGGLIPGLVLLAVGIFALRSKPPEIHQ